MKTRSAITKKTKETVQKKMKETVQKKMKETVQKKMKETVQSYCGNSSTSTGLDENLWGNLQYHIDLAEDVYSKLPFEEFFRLRTVCKAWYVIACKCLDLEEPIHKPFSNLIEYGYIRGIIFYSLLSRSWDWRSGTTQNLFSNAYVASKGVVFSLDWKESRQSYHPSVFHWQSKIHQDLGLPPNLPRNNKQMVLGMIVSEKQGPCSSFKVVLGSPDFDTQVYESGVWQTKPCRVPKHEKDHRHLWGPGCVDCNGRVYINSRTRNYTTVIFVYDFENAKWSSLLSPGDRQHGFHALGVSNGRIFDMMTFQKEEAWSNQVWELVDETLHKWEVYDCMPKGLLSWLQSTEGFPSVYRTKDEDILILSSFCKGFMLVYSWNYRKYLGGRFCLFDIPTKNWQKLNVAAGINRDSR